jgi:hypothetical protein
MGRLWGLVIAVAGGGAIAACSDTDNMREDVVLCEEAASHYESCCGHPLSGLQCVYEYSCLIDCSHAGDTSVPDLAATQSRCMMGLSCGDLAARGICSQSKATLSLAGACR